MKIKILRQFNTDLDNPLIAKTNSDLTEDKHFEINFHFNTR